MHTPTATQAEVVSQALAAPALSVILVTANPSHIARRALDSLRAQTARDQMELVLIVPSLAEVGLNEADLADFRWRRIFEVGRLPRIAQARALAIRAARAPVVVLSEDHVFVEPGWAAALIEAHRGPWVAVAPLILSANPASALGEAGYLLSYAPWGTAWDGRPPRSLPLHDVAFKRAWLLGYGDSLAARLDWEGGLADDLLRRGGQFTLVPTARIYHHNLSHRRSSARVIHDAARVYGAARARRERWSWPRRWLYTLALPLIPVKRLADAWPVLQRTAYPPLRRLQVLLALVWLVVAASVGEVVGYLADARGITYRIDAVELISRDERGQPNMEVL